MKRSEFGQVMAYLGVGIGKPLDEDSLKVYFDCLGDLPYDVLLTAAKRVLLEHKYATFPSIAELREAAAVTAQGRVTAISSSEAWDMASRLACDVDPEIEGQFERKSKGCPPVVIEAIRQFGLRQLCFGTEPVSVQRGQFMKTFEQVAEAEKRAALMPPAMKESIESRNRPMPAPVAKAIAGIGTPVEEGK